MRGKSTKLVKFISFMPGFETTNSWIEIGSANGYTLLL